MKLFVFLTKISPTHHRFEYLRDDGTGEKLELETKTFLFHDFLHFAVETEAGLKDSFYGLLIKNKNYASLTESVDMNGPVGREIGVTERMVGSLTGFLKGGSSPETFLTSLKSWFEAMEETVPSWVTEDFLIRVQNRMRALLGEWNGTPFGKTMRLEFKIK